MCHAQLRWKMDKASEFSQIMVSTVCADPWADFSSQLLWMPWRLLHAFHWCVCSPFVLEGWIKPNKPLAHDLAVNNDGRVFFMAEDVEQDRT